MKLRYSWMTAALAQKAPMWKKWNINGKIIEVYPGSVRENFCIAVRLETYFREHLSGRHSDKLKQLKAAQVVNLFERFPFYLTCTATSQCQTNVFLQQVINAGILNWYWTLIMSQLLNCTCTAGWLMGSRS